MQLPEKDVDSDMPRELTVWDQLEAEAIEKEFRKRAPDSNLFPSDVMNETTDASKGNRCSGESGKLLEPVIEKELSQSLRFRIASGVTEDDEEDVARPSGLKDVYIGDEAEQSDLAHVDLELPTGQSEGIAPQFRSCPSTPSNLSVLPGPEVQRESSETSTTSSIVRQMFTGCLRRAKAAVGGLADNSRCIPQRSEAESEYIQEILNPLVEPLLKELVGNLPANPLLTIVVWLKRHQGVEVDAKSVMHAKKVFDPDSFPDFRQRKIPDNQESAKGNVPGYDFSMKDLCKRYIECELNPIIQDITADCLTHMPADPAQYLLELTEQMFEQQMLDLGVDDSEGETKPRRRNVTFSEESDPRYAAAAAAHPEGAGAGAGAGRCVVS